MARSVIEVRDLGKRYRLRQGRGPYRTLRESIMGLFRFGRKDDALKNSEATNASSKRDFWALKDISFDVAEGEVLGVIGHNGAGKTTLLRLLSRITEPTAGGFRIRGRVGSLLEVGTGFHPELTGRENTFLSGAILGMTGREIAGKFDEIVAFAGVEQFIDMPVKHYSSGMYLRLAFAVAAHLEPEVLLVDEVLAVGDAAFQKKCLGKMQDVAGDGRTVVFVSHNMAAVANLCDKCLWLRQGQLEHQGPTTDIIQEYQDSLQSRTMAHLDQRVDRSGTGTLRFTRIWFTDETGAVIDTPLSGAPLDVHLDYVVVSPIAAADVIAAVVVKDSFGALLFTLSTHLTHADRLELSGGGTLRCHVPMLPLTGGAYSVDLFASVGKEVSDQVHGARQFQVRDDDFYGCGKTPQKHKHGPILVDHRWSIDVASPVEAR